ncbi:MAG: pentapeptide repeat-containing protein [Symploca sp. SIO2G7]|nr:pentapeptide repeat-containing protein [Symploca sp. SIO2G7]
MASEEHLDLLRQGVEIWNNWREKNPRIHPQLNDLDLSGMEFSGANLRKANLSRTNLSGSDISMAILREAGLSEANLSRTNLSGSDISRANLRGANFREANLSETDITKSDVGGADLSRANLSRASLRRADLRGTNLSEVNLSRARLFNTNLSTADLRKADLSGAQLMNADLSGATLTDANLSGVSLIRVQALRTSFKRAILTGACLEDWNINSSTNFDAAICSYVYLKSRQRERRPREGVFKFGEFTALFQQVVDTVDLIFKDGIDWQAFFQSFQDLRSQYGDDNLSIQAIERKQGESFVVRLEVSEGIDRSLLESSAKTFYETKLTLLEQRYRAELNAKEGEISAYKEQSANLMEIVKLQASRPINVEATAVADNSNRKTDLRGAQFGGGYAEVVQGDQIGGTINNYGSNTEDITRLLTALRDQAQTFPTDQKDDANDVLDDLERDLAEEQLDQNRIGRRLKKLVALGAAIGTIASGAAAVSGDVSTFTGNVIELTEKLGIPIEQVQLPPSGTP